MATKRRRSVGSTLLQSGHTRNTRLANDATGTGDLGHTGAKQKRARFWNRNSRKQRRKASAEVSAVVGSVTAAGFAAAALSDDDDVRGTEGESQSSSSVTPGVSVLNP